jgi:hypothetical protein
MKNKQKQDKCSDLKHFVILFLLLRTYIYYIFFAGIFLFRIPNMKILAPPLLHMQDMTLAGTDNPSNAVEWALAEMVNSPELLAKAVEEIDRTVGRERLVQESDLPQLNYVKACIREAFRLHPIAPFNVPHGRHCCRLPRAQGQPCSPKPCWPRPERDCLG